MARMRSGAEDRGLSWMAEAGDTCFWVKCISGQQKAVLHLASLHPHFFFFFGPTLALSTAAGATTPRPYFSSVTQMAFRIRVFLPIRLSFVLFLRKDQKETMRARVQRSGR